MWDAEWPVSMPVPSRNRANGRNKSEVTAEALRSVAEYMLGQLKEGDKAYEITWTNQTTGKKIVLTCHREDIDEKDRDN
jgi:hypothetical protein